MENHRIYIDTISRSISKCGLKIEDLKDHATIYRLMTSKECDTLEQLADEGELIFPDTETRLEKFMPVLSNLINKPLHLVAGTHISTVWSLRCQCFLMVSEDVLTDDDRELIETYSDVLGAACLGTAQNWDPVLDDIESTIEAIVAPGDGLCELEELFWGLEGKGETVH